MKSGSKSVGKAKARYTGRVQVLYAKIWVSKELCIYEVKKQQYAVDILVVKITLNRI